VQRLNVWWWSGNTCSILIGSWTCNFVSFVENNVLFPSHPSCPPLPHSTHLACLSLSAWVNTMVHWGHLDACCLGLLVFVHVGLSQSPVQLLNGHADVALSCMFHGYLRNWYLAGCLIASFTYLSSPIASWYWWFNFGVSSKTLTQWECNWFHIAASAWQVGTSIKPYNLMVSALS
jgi:hypothetical protein